jgi:hypothetical protein
MRAWSLVFYAFGLWFVYVMVSGAATGELRTTGLGRVLLPAFSVSWMLGIHALTVYFWKRRRVQPPADFFRIWEEILYRLFSPRPRTEPELGLWWWVRLAAALFLVNVGAMLVLAVLGRLGFLTRGPL